MSGAPGRVLANDVAPRVDTEGLGGRAPGTSIVVKLPSSSRKPWLAPPAKYRPTMSPRGLIPKAWVDEAPGTSIVVKLPSSSRKP